jgi:hypothetical protein
VDVGSVADIAEVHITSIFRVEIYMLGEFLCTFRFLF